MQAQGVMDPGDVAERMNLYAAQVEAAMGLGSTWRPGRPHGAPCEDGGVVEVESDPEDPIDVWESPFKLTLVGGLGPFPSVDLLGTGIERLVRYLESNGWEIGSLVPEPVAAAGGGERLPMIVAGNPEDRFLVHLEGSRQEPEKYVQAYGFVLFVNSPCFVHPRAERLNVNRP